MVETVEAVALSQLPPAPRNPLPFRQQVQAIRTFHTGVETLRDADGPVTRLRLGPHWLMPPVVVATSPQAARDILGRSGEHAEREALRLCPPAAATSRMALRDMEVDGYRVEAGTMLVVGIYALHRDPARWDHPLTFDPDRFSPQNSEGRDRWQYLPFGAGPRSCIGDHFAMLEATLALATIIRSAEIHSIDLDFPMIVPFTTVAAKPIRAQVSARRV